MGGADMVRTRLPDEEYMLLGRKTRGSILLLVMLFSYLGDDGPKAKSAAEDLMVAVLEDSVFPRNYCPQRIRIHGLWAATMEANCKAFSKKRNEDSDPPPCQSSLPSID
jgi:hypothetical protein